MNLSIRLAVATGCVFVLLAATGCKPRVKNALPATNEVAGWQKTDDTRIFAAKDLWQYIDGDSEQYMNAGVVTTSTSDYKFNNQLEAVVDVHTLRNSDGAQKIFQGGQSADAKTVQIGDAGFAFHQSVVFRKGPYLVRIVAWQSPPDVEQALLALAHGVESKL